MSEPNKTEGARRRLLTRRRATLGLFLVGGPAALAVWSGCSTSSESNGLGKPDPGGTFGAEVVVHVIGAGRVTSSPEALDCPGGPGSCFHRFISDPGAGAPDIALKADASTNWRFVGWTFNTTNAATRGKGPDSCQPFTRASAGAPAGADLAGEEIHVTGGSVPGTPPAGQEGFCSSDVPVAYDVTATFVYAPIADAGPDVDLDGAPDGDAGSVPPIFDPPAIGASAGPIFYRSSRLYWLWTSGVQSAIASGFTTGGSRTDLVGLGPSISAFNVAGSVTYQNASGFASIPLGGGGALPLTGAPTCSAVTSDTSYAYCRSTAGDLLRWDLFGTDAGSGSTLLATGLPSGSDLAVDTSYLFYSGSATGTVNTIPLAGVDGGVPTPNLVATGQSSPSNVQAYGSFYALWQSSFGSIAEASRSGSGVVTTLDTKSGLRTFTVAGSYVWYAVVPSSASGASAIWRVPYTGGTPVLVRQGLTDIRGLASDGSYVYWTQGDGRVYRYYGF